MGNIVLFFDMQRVHIGAKRDCTLAGQRALERTDDAGASDATIDGNAEGFEEPSDQFRRLMLFEGGLGMRVDLVAPLHHLAMKLGDPIDDRHDPQSSETSPLEVDKLRTTLSTAPRSRPWTRPDLSCHRCGMIDKSSEAESELRKGEVAVALPLQSDAGLYFIGTIHTPWRTRQECPKRGSLDGPICSIVVDQRWRVALTGLAGHPRVQVLYWMHGARRDLVLQTPFSTMQTTGTFALRSPVRPNPIASSIVELVAVDGTTLQVRGLDCLDGTPLIDLKPERGASE